VSIYPRYCKRWCTDT